MIIHEEIISQPVAQRFADKCMDIPFAGCRIWMGATNPNGYGTLRVHGDGIKAHRFAWIAANGDIPDGLAVLHRCDVPCCVNPDHLFLGTQLENMQDMAAKGRARGGTKGGSKHYLAKLTEGDVRQIRQLALTSKHADVAAAFNISRSNVGLIVNRKAWAHVD